MNHARTRMLAGAAIFSCVLPSAHAGGPGSNMLHTTFDGGSGSLTRTANGGGEDGFTWSFAGGPTSYYRFDTSTPAGGTGQVIAYNNFLGYDTISVVLGQSGTEFAGSGSFTVTFATKVTFIDLGSWFGYGGQSWSVVGGSAFVDGDEFEAGTYTIAYEVDWAFDYFGYNLSASFAAASGGAVPMPGAAGLAACGLLGLARRRRR